MVTVLDMKATWRPYLLAAVLLAGCASHGDAPGRDIGPRTASDSTARSAAALLAFDDGSETAATASAASTTGEQASAGITTVGSGVPEGALAHLPGAPTPGSSPTAPPPAVTPGTHPSTTQPPITQPPTTQPPAAAATIFGCCHTRTVGSDVAAGTYVANGYGCSYSLRPAGGSPRVPWDTNHELQIIVKLYDGDTIQPACTFRKGTGESGDTRSAGVQVGVRPGLYRASSADCRGLFVGAEILRAATGSMVGADGDGTYRVADSTVYVPSLCETITRIGD